MNILKLLLLSCLITTNGMCLPPQDVPRQGGQYDIENYNSDNGLPQNSVKEIVGDSDGFIWIGSESGLVRYDGSHFTTYDRSVIPISSNRFPLIQRSLDGDNEKLFAINENYEFVAIKNGSARFDPKYHSRYIKPLYAKLGDSPTFLGGNRSPLESHFRPNIIINLAAQKGNYLYAHGDTAEYYLAGKKSSSIRMAYGKIWSLFRIDQDLYLPQDDGTFLKPFSNQQTGIEIDGDITKNIGYRLGLKNFQIFWNNTANQVFIRLNNKIYLVDYIENNKLHTFLVSEGFELLLNDFVKFYYHKKAAVLFAGSLTKGLFVIRKKLFRTFEPSNGLDPVFYGQTVFGKESVLTGRGNVLGPNDNSVILPIHHIRPNTHSMVTDSKGAIWFPQADTLFRYDRNQNKLKDIWASHGEITAIYYVDSSRILVATRKLGLFLFDPFKPEDPPKLFASGPFLKDVICLLKKDAQNVLIGTEHGLFQTNSQSGVVSLVKGTGKLHIRSLHISKSG